MQLPREFTSLDVSYSPLSLTSVVNLTLRQGDTQLRLRHHVVDMRHLVIVRIVRRSRGSVQPVFQVHPYFWDLYP